MHGIPLPTTGAWEPWAPSTLESTRRRPKEWDRKVKGLPSILEKEVQDSEILRIWNSKAEFCFVEFGLAGLVYSGICNL